MTHVYLHCTYMYIRVLVNYMYNTRIIIQTDIIASGVKDGCRRKREGPEIWMRTNKARVNYSQR